MKNMTFKISVIMPVYNAEDELNTAIDSIINQSFGFENIELIIVDDCSTDNSRNIITDYANEYENIIPVFLDENSGLPGKPRSLGIKYASADYISFLDSDDEYLKDGLKNLYDTILSEDSDFVIGFSVRSINCHQKICDLSSQRCFSVYRRFTDISVQKDLIDRHSFFFLPHKLHFPGKD